MGFSTEKTDALWWLMISNDVNAVRAVLSLLPSERWKEDHAKDRSGSIGPTDQGKWDLTLANAWGMMAMEKFSKALKPSLSLVHPSHSVKPISDHGLEEHHPQGKVSLFPWPAEKRRSFAHPSGNRKTLGHHPEPCGHSSQRAFIKRVHD